MTLPYYITWSAQENAKVLSLKGCDDYHLITTDNIKLLNLSSISYQANFGHFPKEIINRMINQSNHLCMTPSKAVFDYKSKVSNKILNLIGGGVGKLFYTVSGAESVENALKMARQISGKKLIASRGRAYHGATLGAISVSGDWRSQKILTAKNWTVKIPEPYEDPKLVKTQNILEKVGYEKIAAFCLETVTGSNGVIVPSASWWEGISELCRKHNIYLILDEVSCGFYRVGKPFGWQLFNSIQPDFVCMAKAMSGGIFPIGAVWTSDRIYRFFDKEILYCGLTNYAHPLGLACIDAVCDIINDNKFIENYRTLEELFNRKLQNIKKMKNIKEVRYIGMLACIELNKIKADGHWTDMVKKGIYTNFHNNNIILAPPLTIPPPLLEEGLLKLENFIAEINE